MSSYNLPIVHVQKTPEGCYIVNVGMSGRIHESFEDLVKYLEHLFSEDKKEENR